MMMANDAKCPAPDLLQQYSWGRLETLQSTRIDEHLLNCDVCAAEMETIDDGEDSLIGLLRGPAPTQDFESEPGCEAAISKAASVLATVNHSQADGEGTLFQDPVTTGSLPENIGEYEIVRPLGHGGMGSVYLARHTKLGREVALKVMATHRLADPRMLSRFEAEMKAVGRLSHPQIVTAHDAREVDGTAVLVTEFIDGVDLGDLVRRHGPLEVADACEIIRQVAVALQYTSDQGFVHRDIKPSNIMLGTNGDVKLLDLGLALFQVQDSGQPELTATGQAMGTADYVAPEQVTNSHEVDIRADIYGLGCTLMKLLTGDPPFSGPDHDSPFAKMTAHVSQKPPSVNDRRTDVPKSLSRLVDAMLAKNPDRRPDSPRQVAQQLTAFCDGHSLEHLAERVAETGAQPIARTERHRRPQSTIQPRGLRRRVPVWYTIATGCISLLIGFLLAIIIQIKYPDGTIARMVVPEGSRVTMRSDAEGKPNLDANPRNVAPDPATAQFRQPDGSELAPPVEPRMQFQVLLSKTDIRREDRGAAESFLGNAFTREPAADLRSFSTPWGQWVAIADHVEAPIISQVGNRRFALATYQNDDIIYWEELLAGIESVDVAVNSEGPLDQHRLQLSFDFKLANRMQVLTNQHAGRQLALVVDGQVVLAPKIHSTIRQSAVLTGNLSRAELERISNSITREQKRRQLGHRPTADALKVRERLQEIGRAFHDFEAAYGRFPGSINTKEGGQSIRGKKMYPFSWRVALLPFLEQNELFEQYRFDEPWDSEANKKLLEQMPDIYCSDANQGDGLTSFLGFSNETGIMASGYPRRLEDITDGTSQTILVVQSKSTVPWTKPHDLTSDRVESPDGHGLTFLLADGSVHYMSPVDEYQIKSMLTRNGAEVIGH